MTTSPKTRAILKIDPNSDSMSTETKNFIQKICYKKSASVDMTTFGFIRDSKVKQMHMLLKPLRDLLEQIFGPGGINKK